MFHNADSIADIHLAPLRVVLGIWNPNRPTIVVLYVLFDLNILF